MGPDAPSAAPSATPSAAHLAAAVGGDGRSTPDADLAATLTEHDLHHCGRRIITRRFVTIGGGLGSLAMAHVLRIAGVTDDDLAVVGPLASPAETYEYLATNSQIPRRERLRSDSGSTIDAVWGWPGYALREAVADASAGPVLRVLGEPLFGEFFTPRAGQVYRSVDRESARLGWDRLLIRGWVTAIRRNATGGYWVVVDGPDRARLAIRAEHVHIAIGYPGVALLGDLREFRQRHPDLGYRVVNAYEPHDYVYEQLRRRPSTVLVRGSGIVASRVLQRLLDDVEHHGARTEVVHLFRNYVDGPQGTTGRFRRPGGGGFAYQAFNYPKSSWGGQLRSELERLDGAERAELIDRMGGTNTAPRRSWRRQLRRHGRSGTYRQLHGTVNSVQPAGDPLAHPLTGLATDRSDAVRTVIRTTADPSEHMLLDADYVIDATGLQADPARHPLFADLIARSGARRNPKGRLAVEPSFELTGTRSGDGRLYASGAMTLGGGYAGVDSFLGLQYAALRIADDLAATGALPRIGPIRSTVGWVRWATNRRHRAPRATSGAATNQVVDHQAVGSTA
ncbi:MAG: hypothetical protein AAGG08_01340 [Actinomycetota bacterium]